ncbi:DUF2794 domain-containing protein [Fulvimarina sp. 2208YS6-2-32]|uniref:DUF2794 domain-containing protein n=1 Tax=Fulvimarina uroteuthidis TaxID=3098149 RepID=A0ABU5HX52_9HYPH|nr:DUF2794 domain-containing protein [Fulvimarina sp. 2208YS6-2-32]MDY8107615.1 DUF2794 domain-containing protein [Fulvimarina sp. 2208YS6-2-32]
MTVVSSTETSNLIAFPGTKGADAQIVFDRKELSAILKVYGRMVAAGDWRDYAIDMLKDRAVFSIFRRTSEMPIYRVEKNPKLARKQGAYQVVAAGGLVMKRGHDLGTVLNVFDRQLKGAEQD